MALEGANGLLVSNHSYGSRAGWDQTNGDWVWYGDTSLSQTESHLFGYYDGTARSWDNIAYNAPYYLITKSAGNSRGDGPGSATSHPVNSPNASPVTRFRPDNGPYDCIPAGGSTAKNTLVVGAVNDVAGGYSGPSSVNMSSFSSWGPTDDGRIKPDVVANGVSVFSASDKGPKAYDSKQGTSMSGPAVAGSMLLLQEHAKNKLGYHLKAATIKALTIHTTDECGSDPGPDYRFGWGLVNTEKAARTISDAGLDHLIVEDTLMPGMSDTLTITAANSQALWGTLVWMDKPAQTPAIELNPRDTLLVNDLDLRIIDSNTTTSYQPWKLDVLNPSNAATKGDNQIDNVEKVELTPTTGNRYQVVVSHKGSLADGQQAYSLVVSGKTRPANPVYCGTQSISNYSGTFTDGSGPGFDYSNNANCSWLINTEDTGRLIEFAFDSLDLAAGDSVYIYEGSDANGTLLGAYSGSTPPSSIPVASGGMAYVLFISNAAVNAKGFQLHFQSSALPEAEMISSSRSVCAGTNITFLAQPLRADNAGYSYSWNFQGASPATQNGKSVTVAYNTSGLFDVTLTISNAKGSTVVQLDKYINVYTNNPVSQVSNFDFQGLSFPLDTAHPNLSWTLDPLEHDQHWEKYVAEDGGNGDSTSIRIKNWSTQRPNNRQLISPIYDFSGVSNAELAFDYNYAIRGPLSNDTLKVEMSTDCGNNWNDLWKVGTFNSAVFYSADLQTFPGSVNGSDWQPLADYWETDTLSRLGLAYGQSEVQFRFSMGAGGGNYFYIDNIRLVNLVSNKSLVSRSFDLRVFPNPVSTRSQAIYELKEASHVRLRLSDVSGKVIGQKDMGNQRAGQHQISLEDFLGGIERGVYLLHLRTESGQQTIKLVR